MSVPPNAWHSFRADSEKIVRIDDDNGPQADVLVVTASAYEDPKRAPWYDGSDVILAAEVESPSSRVRDRERKPQIYAKAAIKTEGISPALLHQDPRGC